MKMFFNHGIHRIHGTLLSLVLLFGVAVSAVAAEPGITVEARQRYPWNGLVDLKFTITGESGTKYDTSFTAKDMVGGTNVAMKTIRKSNGVATEEKEKLLPGTYNWIWDAAADLPNDFECERMTISGVMEEYNPLYMVIDLSGGVNASSYPISYLSEVPEGGWTDEYKTTKLVLRRIEPGTFKMGDTKNVTMKKTFYMGIFEVTQKQYCLVTGSSPWENSYVYKSIGDCFPAVNISWNDIRGNSSVHNWPTIKTVDSNSFVGRIRLKSGLSIDLPTEAQWEYSVRAGTTTRFYWGDSDWRSHAQEYEWVNVTGTDQSYFEVGTKKSNPWGLYDTLGNAPEWCLDWFADLRGSEVDPEGPNSPGRSPYNGSLYDRVVRHVNTESIISNVGVYSRTWEDPARGSFNGFTTFYGFRVAVSLTE